MCERVRKRGRVREKEKRVNDGEREGGSDGVRDGE